MQKQKLVILDDNLNYVKKYNDKNSFIILWNGYEEDITQNCFSILKQIKNNSYYFRDVYLKWTFSLSEIKYMEKDVKNYFIFDNNFSFWSLSLFNEKCNFIKSPEINDTIKLIALENLIKNKKFHKVIIHSSNCSLVECLHDWCRLNSIKFDTNISLKTYFKINLFKNTFKFLKSFFWLFLYFVKRRSFGGFGLKKWKNIKSKLIFISYLTNFDQNKLIKGEFKSHFWGELPKIISKNDLNSKWIQIWDPGVFLKNPKDVKNALTLLNNKTNNNQFHLTIDSFISLRIILKTLKVWLLVVLKSMRIKKIFFKNYRIGFNLTLVQKNDWSNSFYGIEGLKNILFYFLFNEALKMSDNSCTGLYLQENQGWEFGLINAWRTNQNGKICGVPHFTIRFWDLRYFFCNECFSPQTDSLFLRPDYVLVNGIVQKQNLLDIGYPKKELIEIEALRYNYLSHMNEKLEIKNDVFKILVLGDYENNSNKELLTILEKSLKEFNYKYKIFYKPHPASKQFNYQNKINIENIEINLSEILSKVNFVLCGGNSSVALDVIYHKTPLAVYLNQKTLNLSPLNKHFDNLFFSNQHELAIILKEEYLSQKKSLKKINYFYLDKGIPLWLDFLKK